MELLTYDLLSSSVFFSGIQQELTLLKTRSLPLLMCVPNHIPLFESLHILSAESVFRLSSA